MDDIEQFNLVVLGPALGGEGYPNAENTIRILSKTSHFCVKDKARWLGRETRLWNLSKGGLLTQLALFLKLSISSIHGCLLAIRGRDAICYFPYPSIFCLFLISFLPQRLRPICISDAFNLIWPSFVADRNQADSRSLISKLIYYLEKRAFVCADRVFVDTVAHERLCRRVYRLNPNKVSSLPLALPEFWSEVGATNNANSLEQPQCKKARRALFLGTLIPLHGLSVILDSADLSKSARIKIVGEGQESWKILERKSPVDWERVWMSQDSLKDEINKADFLLGVFGGKGKAARVLPWKIYIGMASGKAVVTQRLISTPKGVPTPPLILINANGDSLARVLDRTPLNALKKMGASNRLFFEKYLSEHAIASRWLEELREIKNSANESLRR